MKYYAIKDANLWDQINADIGEQAGCYVLCSQDGARFRPVSRALGVDDNGVLYIGAAKCLSTRAMDLRKALCAAVGRDEYTDIDAHGCGRKYSETWHRLFPFESLVVALHPTAAGDPRWATEIDLLQEYENQFGETPPFNELPPKARRQAWKDRRSADSKSITYPFTDGDGLLVAEDRRVSADRRVSHIEDHFDLERHHE